MLLRRLLAVAGGLALLGLASERASAQNEAPFTIRRPPDGATVREKVRVQIPLASIPEGGYVTFYIDGQFHVAVTPSAAERQALTKAAAKANRPALYEFVWDTKKPMKVKGSPTEEAPKDGEHVIEARLYAPKESGGTELKDTSAVRVTVANKAIDDPGPVRLRYKYIYGDTRVYNRTGDTAVVVGLTQGLRGSGDQELVSQRSQVLLSVEDVYPQGHAIVRNKLTSLRVRQGGQETFYPAEQLPNSLYQELDSIGKVHYQNDTTSFTQFAQLGVPVSTTIDLPILPSHPVKVGDRWTTANVPLDIPGTPPDKQPRVTVTSTFEGVEWEGGYPTARIRQTYNSGIGGMKEKSITFGTIEVENPQMKFERDIYLAYRSGRLVKMVRKLEVTGKTTQSISPAGGVPGMAGGPPGMMGGSPASMMQMMGMRSAGAGGLMTGPPPGVMRGGTFGGGIPGMAGTPSGPPPGVMMGGYMGMMSGQRGGGRGGLRGMPGISGGPRGATGGLAGGPRMPGGLASGAPTGMFPRGSTGGATLAQTGQQITLKSTTVTELSPSSAQTASAR